MWTKITQVCGQAVTVAAFLCLFVPSSAFGQVVRSSGIRGARTPAVGHLSQGPLIFPQQGPGYQGPTLDVAGIGRVPVTLSPIGSSGYFSSGSFSANRFGRSVTGIGRGPAGVSNHWQGFHPSRSSAIVAPGYGWGSSYWVSSGRSYVIPYATWNSVPYTIWDYPVTPWNASMVPVIAPLPGYNPYYGYSAGVGPAFWGGGIGAACGYLPGLTVWGYSTSISSPAITTGLPSAFLPPAPAADLQQVAFDNETKPVVPDFSGQVPVRDEFSAVPVKQTQSSLPDKIHSLRYQASGDDAFRKHDFATAEVFYQTAVQTAPERPAAALRMAFVHIAQGNFPDAVAWLKTGLQLPTDRTQAWIPWPQLYGNDGAELMRQHSDRLWEWVAERPLSTDRLLLAGTFQKLREYDGTADELLKLVRDHGQPEHVAALFAIINSTRQARSGATSSLQQSLDALRSTGRSTAAAATPVSTDDSAQLVIPEQDNR